MEAAIFPFPERIGGAEGKIAADRGKLRNEFKMSGERTCGIRIRNRIPPPPAGERPEPDGFFGRDGGGSGGGGGGAGEMEEFVGFVSVKDGKMGEFGCGRHGWRI